MNPNKMNVEELAKVLDVQKITVKRLGKTKQLPCTYNKSKMYFDFDKVLKHFKFLEANAV